MSNVEPIHAGVLIPQRSVDADTVRVLEEMLAAARSGEIIGFAGAVLLFGGLAARRRAGTGSYSLAGALQSSVHILHREMLDQ